MGFAHDTLALVGKALSGVHAGQHKLALRKLDAPGISGIDVKSIAFSAGMPLPSSALGDVPPPISWGEVPAAARSIVVLCEDPDVPFPRPFVHWLVWAIPPSVRELDGESVRYFRQGRNSNLRVGWAPPAPPPGHGVHHYHFQVFALDAAPDIERGEGRKAILDAMKGHVIGRGDLVGTHRVL